MKTFHYMRIATISILSALFISQSEFSFAAESGEKLKKREEEWGNGGYAAGKEESLKQF